MHVIFAGTYMKGNIAARPYHLSALSKLVGRAPRIAPRRASFAFARDVRRPDHRRHAPRLGEDRRPFGFEHRRCPPAPHRRSLGMAHAHSAEDGWRPSGEPRRVRSVGSRGPRVGRRHYQNGVVPRGHPSRGVHRGRRVEVNRYILGALVAVDGGPGGRRSFDDQVWLGVVLAHQPVLGGNVVGRQI